MTQEGTRRRKAPRLYNVVVVPVEEGGKTRTFRTSRLTMGALVLLGFLASVAVTLAILVYTPLAMYVPIPNPGLEEKYGRQIVETQRRLASLAEDVVLLKDYNAQLRKALGEGGPRDTSAARNLPRRGERIVEETAPPPSGLQHAGDPDIGVPLDEDLGADATTAHYAMVSTASGPSRASFPLLTPVEGFVTQGFDPSRNHFGMDIAGQRGTPVHAPGDGVILFAGWTYDDGNMIIIAHGGGYCTVFKHNQALLKNALSGVKRGEPIALLGTSGKTSLGPHLHFEVWKNGVPQDPNEYLLAPARTH
jgi:murein DD-endopeptidase MepM/ murein hydrolase activator NlpD